jgi:hypothetical protein
MKRETLLLAVALAMLPVVGVAAQEILSFDIGYSSYYQVGGTQESLVFQPNFSFNVGLTENLTASFKTIGTGAASTDNPTFFFLGLKYQVVDKLRVITQVGAINTGSAAAAVGLGFDYTPFSRKIGSLVTAFTVNVEYLATADALGEGYLNFGLAVSVGL